MKWEKISGLAIFLLNSFLFLYFLFTQRYSVFLVALNTISVLAVWIWLINPKKVINFLKKNKTDLIISIILFFASLILLSYKIDSLPPGIYGDDMVAATNGVKFINQPEMSPFLAGYPHPLVSTYLTGWSAALFGHNIFAVRFPAIVGGCMAAVAMFVLLRMFFNRKLALVTALIFTFSYQHLVVGRQADFALAFQIIALIFLYLFFKRKDTRSLIAFGLAIGGGLHFYITMRIISVFMVILCLFAFKNFSFKKILNYLLILLISIFISTAVLSSYVAVHWDTFWARPAGISVFGRNLPPKEVVNEISGSLRNDLGLFLFKGDPNPRFNPSGIPLYDPLSSILILSGFVLLFLKQRKLFFIFLFLAIPALVNDIFSVEIFPEFHFYGTGHPNSLRISGFIPLFYLLIGFALANFEPIVKKISKEFANIALIFVCCLLIIINFYSYFGQQSINPDYFVYNYRYGNGFALDVYNYLNKKGIAEAYAPSIFRVDFANFFLNKTVLKSVDDKNVQESTDLILASKVVVVNALDNDDFLSKLSEKLKGKPIPYVRLDTSFGPYGALIFNSN